MILTGVNKLELEESRFDYVTIGRPHYEDISERPDPLSWAARHYRSLKVHGQDPEVVMRNGKNPGRIQRAIDELEERGELEIVLNPQIRIEDNHIKLYGGDLWMLSPEQVILEQYGNYIHVEDVGSSYGTALDGILLGVNKKINDLNKIGTAVPPTFKGEARISNEAVLSLAHVVLHEEYSIRVRPE